MASQLSSYKDGFGIKYPTKFFILYLPTPPLGQDMTQGRFLSEV